METCGYCDGTGQIDSKPYDNEGREIESVKVQCEYCDGAGECQRGSVLLSAIKWGK
jgi:DnaJ-class molecular chaperone